MSEMPDLSKCGELFGIFNLRQNKIVDRFSVCSIFPEYVRLCVVSFKRSYSILRNGQRMNFLVFFLEFSMRQVFYKRENRTLDNSQRNILNRNFFEVIESSTNGILNTQVHTFKELFYEETRNNSVFFFFLREADSQRVIYCSLLPWACHRSQMRQNFQEPRSFVGYPLYSRESLVVLPLPDTKIDYFQQKMKENYVGAIDSKNPCVFYLKSLKYICTQCETNFE